MALGSNSFRSVAGNLPGYQSPTQAVGQFQNQQIASRPSGPTPSQPITSVPRTLSGRPMDTNPVMMSVNRTTAAVQQSSNSAMGYAQVAGARRRKALATPPPEMAQSAQKPMYRPGGGASSVQPTVRGGGQTVGRVQGMLKGYPGLRITEIGGNRESDQRRGVKRWSGSLHYDKKNPAVDIGGSTAQLDKLYQQMRSEGGFRQILWRVPGHYDHIHVG